MYLMVLYTGANRNYAGFVPSMKFLTLSGLQEMHEMLAECLWKEWSIYQATSGLCVNHRMLLSLFDLQSGTCIQIISLGIHHYAKKMMLTNLIVVVDSPLSEKNVLKTMR